LPRNVAFAPHGRKGAGFTPKFTSFMLLSPLGARLGEGVMQGKAFGYPLT